MGRMLVVVLVDGKSKTQKKMTLLSSTYCLFAIRNTVTPAASFRIFCPAFSVSLGNRQTNAMVRMIVAVNAETLIINELYQSVQRKTTWAALPRFFTRLPFS